MTTEIEMGIMSQRPWGQLQPGDMIMCPLDQAVERVAAITKAGRGAVTVRTNRHDHPARIAKDMIYCRERAR